MSDLPQTFDRFQIVRVLGKGGMGTVYLGRDNRLDRSVALKVLNATELGRDDRRARFLREARASAAIRHQNVATIYEVDQTDDGVPYIVMEYCEGETLGQRIRRRPLDAGEFLNIARQLAAGVAAAHDSGIVHRDIKSANVIIEPSGQVKILDFGLARLLQREMSADKPTFESTSGHFFGTLHYVSPEQAFGRPADERSDLFSLGVVFYQMATGQLPFNADAPLTVLQKIRQAEPEPFVPLDPKFPPTAAKVIGRLLQKDPGARYQNARELLADLEEIDTPTVRIRDITGTRSLIGRTVARPHWMRLAVIIAAFILGGAGIWYANVHSRPAPVTDTTPPAPAPIRSMAVLPLDNIANNTRDDFLSVGLADALVTKLQTIPSLQVRPTSAVLQFRNQKVDPRRASDILRVDGVLQGHFLAAGDLVRVNLQLTDSRTGYNVWADTIDGKRDNLLQLIDEVSSRTVNGLNDKLGVKQVINSSQPRSSNPKAYEEYLKARSLAGGYSPADRAAQMALLKHAIQLDPNFAAAYAELSIAMSLGRARGFENEENALERAESYARQAVRLDPNLPQAHLALGRLFVRFPDRFREAARENLAALRLNPSDPSALENMATYFISTGDVAKAQCVGDRMMRIDPNATQWKLRGYWYINGIDPEDAIRAAGDALSTKDTALAGHDIRGVAFILLGNLDAAQEEVNAMNAILPTHYLPKSLRAEIAAARGDRPTAEAAIQSFQNDALHNHWAAIRVALCYARLGDRDKAVQWVNKAAELGHHSWYELVKHPWFQPLQADPEFAKVVEKVKSDLDDVRDDFVGVYQLFCK